MNGHGFDQTQLYKVSVPSIQWKTQQNNRIARLSYRLCGHLVQWHRASQVKHNGYVKW